MSIFLVIVGVIVVAGLVVGGIIWSKGGALTVQTAKVMREDLAAIVTASGEIKPPDANLANVNANSFGKITDIYVKEGDTVKKGQLLLKTEAVQATANIDAQKAALNTTKADVEGSQAAIQSAAASLKTSQADLQTAQANLVRAQGDFERGKDLLRDKLIAQQVFDQRLNDFKVAQSNIDAAQARVAQAKAQLQQATYNHDMARTRVTQNEATLVGLLDARDKTIYTSPLDGIVTSLPVHVGENVVPGVQNAVGQGG
jgi:HlyD family secretion protein